MASGREICILECIVRTPLFSIRAPHAYQVKKSILIPSTQTLVGVLTKTVIEALTDKGLKISYKTSRELYEDLLEPIRKELVQYVLSATTRMGSPLVRNSIIWKLIRYDRLKEGRKPIESFDAMVKEVVSTYIFYIYYVLSQPYIKIRAFTIDVDELLMRLYTCNRVGDTESLVTIQKVSIITQVETGTNNIVHDVNTTTFLGLGIKEVKHLLEVTGGHCLIEVHGDPWEKLTRTETRYGIYAIPVKLEVQREPKTGTQLYIYRPSKFSVKSTKGKAFTYYAFKSEVDNSVTKVIDIQSYYPPR